jgi:putative hemolysin
MSDMWIEILIILLLILFNGLFAMAEIAVVSGRKARLQQMADEGDASAQAALDLANSPGDFLSTIQVGITLVGILAGAFGGATIAKELAPYIAGIPALAPYSDIVSIVIVVIPITYLTIVIGELVPKRIALNKAESIAKAIASPMRMLSLLAMPIVILLSLSTELILWVLHVKPSTEPPVTEEEIKVLIDQGAKAGVFEEAESDMVESIFRLSDRRVSAMMVPRTDLTVLYLDDTVNDIVSKIAESGHSSYPVCDNGDLDNVIGIVYVKDLLARHLVNGSLDLKATMKEPLFMPESMPALKALELFKKSGKHMAVVIDEYGGLQGLVTIHDIMEAVVGDVPTITSPKAVERDDGSWLVDGMMSIDEFKNMLDIKSLPDEETGTFQTLGGFMMAHLHRIPTAGNRFTMEGYTYEVLDMDGMRVDKVLVTPPKAEEPDEKD